MYHHLQDEQPTWICSSSSYSSQPALEKQPRVKSGEQETWEREAETQSSCPHLRINESFLLYLRQVRTGLRPCMRWEYWGEMVVKAERFVSLKNCGTHYFCSCGLWEALLCIILCKEWGALHTGYWDIAGCQGLVWSYFSFCQRKPMPFQQIENNKEEKNPLFFLPLLLAMTRLLQDGSTGTTHSIRSLPSKPN